MLAAWFPGAELPLKARLQFVVDGAPWGPRFSSPTDGLGRLSKGLGRFTRLAGYWLTGFRRAAGPAALDLVFSSQPPPMQRRELQARHQALASAAPAPSEWFVVSGVVVGGVVFGRAGG